MPTLKLSTKNRLLDLAQKFVKEINRCEAKKRIVKRLKKLDNAQLRISQYVLAIGRINKILALYSRPKSLHLSHMYSRYCHKVYACREYYRKNTGQGYEERCNTALASERKYTKICMDLQSKLLF